MHSYEYVIVILQLATVFLASRTSAAVCQKSGDRWISGGLTSGQKAKLLEVHNQVRNKVASGGTKGQPPAQNMRELVWDDQLAKKAQSWASKCVFEHEATRLYPGKGKGNYGQNLFMSSYTGSAHKSKLEEGVWDWYDEVKSYKFRKVTMKNFHKTGHYTQEVWANTKKVGCGQSVFQSDGWTRHYLVCNYYIAGNMIGQFPYVSGSRNCGKFDMKPSTKYKSLCH